MVRTKYTMHTCSERETAFPAQGASHYYYYYPITMALGPPPKPKRGVVRGHFCVPVAAASPLLLLRECINTATYIAGASAMIVFRLPPSQEVLDGSRAVIRAAGS